MDGVEPEFRAEISINIHDHLAAAYGIDAVDRVQEAIQRSITKALSPWGCPTIVAGNTRRVEIAIRDFNAIGVTTADRITHDRP